MGLLRLWLAFIVLTDHIPPNSFLAPLNGALAIQGFYILSGFFIQYVLHEHYKGAFACSYMNFYLSRALRIFPSFYFILAASLLFTLWFGGAPRDSSAAFFTVLSQASLPHMLYYLLSQLMIFGSSFTRFLSFNEALGQFYPMTLRIGGTLHIPGAGSMLLVPQMWSLEIELMFYLLAPFLLRLKDVQLVMLFAASLAMRLWANLNGLYLFQFNNDFFPAEIGIFLLGALAARFYIRYLKDSQRDMRFTGWTGLAALVVYSFAYPLAEMHWMVKNWLFLGLFAMLLPMLFKASSALAWDRWIGDLAYPVYLSHYLANGLAREIGFTIPLGAYALTFLLSVAMLIFIERPVHAWRHARFCKPRENTRQGRSEPPGQQVAA